MKLYALECVISVLPESQEKDITHPYLPNWRKLGLMKYEVAETDWVSRSGLWATSILSTCKP